MIKGSGAFMRIPFDYVVPDIPLAELRKDFCMLNQIKEYDHKTIKSQDPKQQGIKGTLTWIFVNRPFGGATFDFYFPFAKRINIRDIKPHRKNGLGEWEICVREYFFPDENCNPKF